MHQTEEFQFDTNTQILGTIAVQTGTVDGLQTDALATFVLALQQEQFDRLWVMSEANPRPVIRFTLVTRGNPVWSTEGTLVAFDPTGERPLHVSVTFEPLNDRKHLLGDLRRDFGSVRNLVHPAE